MNFKVGDRVIKRRNLRNILGTVVKIDITKSLEYQMDVLWDDQSLNSLTLDGKLWFDSPTPFIVLATPLDEVLK